MSAWWYSLTPGYASVLRPVRGEGTVPSVYNAISQILGFFEVFLITGQFVCFGAVRG